MNDTKLVHAFIRSYHHYRGERRDRNEAYNDARRFIADVFGDEAAARVDTVIGVDHMMLP